MADHRTITFVVGEGPDGCLALQINNAESFFDPDSTSVAVHLGAYTREGMLAAKTALNEVFENAILMAFNQDN